MTPNCTARSLPSAVISVARAKRGVTLLEILIVFAIIGIMMGLLFPAIQAARKSSHITACDNNVRQIDLGLRMYVDVQRGYFPFPFHDDQPSGWALAILPFIEEIPLSERFAYDQPITSPQNLAAAAHRPDLFQCPVTVEIESTIPGVGVTNYLVVIDQTHRDRGFRNRNWQVKDAPEGSRYPWCTSPEKAPADGGYPAPHTTAFGF
jgi:prepilin-type N-terminal cleavage/methylation domain-containing protein